MRVLLSTAPAIGHLYPLLPLAHALRDHGHQIAVLASPTLAADVHEAGFEHLAAGPGIDVLLSEGFRRYPQLAGLVRTRQAMRASLPIFGEVRLELTLPEALPAARAWRPDLVISEHGDFVGPLVAAALGVRAATLGFGPGHHPSDWLALATESVAASYAAQGLTPPEHGGLYQDIYLDTCPTALQEPAFPQPSSTWRLRPVAHHQAGATWTPAFPGRDDHRLVLVTMGTIFGEPAIFKTVLAALGETDANVLVTVGPHGDSAAIAADPARVRVERFVPLDLVLPTCDLVIAHGGAGTTLAALATGLPLVLLPQAPDQFINADRATAAGAALTIEPEALDTDQIARAVERITSDPAYSMAAGRIRDDILAMPEPATVAARLATELAG